MILITGAAGKTGRAIIRALAQRRASVRAFVHSPAQASILKALGAEEVLVDDLRDPSAVERAVQGVRAIYHMAPNISPDEVSIGKNAIAAAQSGGVERFVFHSVFHPQVEAMPHHWLKSRVEELLFQSGLSYTILQPTMYMQNVLGPWDQISSGRYPVPYALETRLGLVDLEDVAEGAAIVLTQPGYGDEIIEMVGALAMSQIQIAEALSEQLGHRVVAESVPVETWERRARASGLGDYQRSTLMKMFAYYETYGFSGNPNALRALLQRQPTSFEDFVKRILGERKDAIRVG
jgi:NAD(P)H dehydrogenase (quinone)